LASAAFIVARAFFDSNRGADPSNTAAQYSAKPRSKRGFHPRSTLRSRARHCRSGAGANRNSSRSHGSGNPQVAPSATAVSRYGAAITTTPAASAGRISQRSRNARSAA